MSEPAPIRVLVVDDHPMTRAGLGLFLKAFRDLELVGEATSGEEALALCTRARPDVILMDMKLPGIDGVAATQAIKQRHPQMQIIALMLRHLNNRARLAQVLSTCCELHGGAPGELEELIEGEGGRSLAVLLVEGVLWTCDLSRIIEAAELDARVAEMEKERTTAPQETETPSEVSAMEIIAAILAERFSCAPHEVMTWPYEEAIDLIERVIPAIDKMRHPERPDVFGMTEDEWVARFRAGKVIPGSPMPWQTLSRMNEEDLRAIYQYLKSLPPVKNDVGPAKVETRKG